CRHRLGDGQNALAGHREVVGIPPGVVAIPTGIVGALKWKKASWLEEEKERDIRDIAEKRMLQR
ncbi:MAG TPA: hypothetical protein PK364_13045, partial [Synergistaceae bacterium]|nr:hypothetical protein [Synergistaceae bacterium]